jgi:hypothetical protein
LAICGSQVDLVFPRTLQQMHQLVSDVLPTVGDNVRELKVTGFHNIWEFRWHVVEAESNTLSNLLVLDRIGALCGGLAKFVIRRCRMEAGAVTFQDYMPRTLEELEFHGCR